MPLGNTVLQINILYFRFILLGTIYNKKKYTSDQESPLSLHLCLVGCLNLITTRRYAFRSGIVYTTD
jgi:hypothetical protein